MDEITVDLDVLARADLLAFLRKECQERGATIIYATHIFDGLEDWPTHIVIQNLLFCSYTTNEQIHITQHLFIVIGVCSKWEVAISNANGESEGDKQEVIDENS